MFCPNCGIQLPDGSKFCNNCGFKVDRKIAAPFSGNTVARPVAPAGLNQNTAQRSEKRSSSGMKKYAFIGIAAVLVVAAIVLLGEDREGGENTAAEQSAETATQETVAATTGEKQEDMAVPHWVSGTGHPAEPVSL